jgi:hypothetical protein
METEIEAIEALYHELDGGGQPGEILDHADVESVISMFGEQRSTEESAFYEEEPRRSTDRERGDGRLSQPIRIPLDEDDYISPTGGYLDMDSDLEDDYISPKEDGKPSVWDRQSFMDETRNGETRSRFVRNVGALYGEGDREKSTIGGGAPPVSALPPRKPVGFI